jgi:two-component system response regulator NreC
MKNNIVKFSCLTKREKETLKFIINGDDNKQIAEKMHVSPHTIRTHRNRIWQKLEIKHLVECLKYACFFN